jgi:hypothetical protein
MVFARLRGKTMRGNIKRTVKLLREAAKELERVYVVKKGQLEEEEEEVPPEFRGLTMNEVIDKVIGLGSEITIDCPEADTFYVFTVEKAAAGDEIWHGEPILVLGTLEWMGRRFKHAECWIEIFGVGDWVVEEDVCVRFPYTIGITDYTEDEAYWCPRNWKYYDRRMREHILSTGERIS